MRARGGIDFAFHGGVALHGGPMNLRLAGMALCALAVMILMTACLGPGVGVEANCVSLQTCGKTLLSMTRDAFAAARLGLPAMRLHPV
jgi:hypothetical protein